jgi:hypothetical protein
METHNRSYNDRGAWVALCPYFTHTATDNTDRTSDSLLAFSLNIWPEKSFATTLAVIITCESLVSLLKEILELLNTLTAPRSLK